MQFDFFAHELVIQTTEGQRRTVELAPRTVADFYGEVMSTLRALGIDVRIWTMPVEVSDPIPFEKDIIHRAYDAEQVRRFFDVLVSTRRVMERFRAGFIGKCSPIHFFWGAFDFVVSRYSGRLAPPHPPVPNASLPMVQEAYSHQVCSAGFWPGGGPALEPVFFSYAYPEPHGYAAAELSPSDAHYDENLREYILPYEAVRTASSPDDALLAFLDSSYDAAAELGHWDRDALERDRAPRLRSVRRMGGGLRPGTH
jgi:hypothetical protein